MPTSRPPQSVALAALWMMGAVASLIGIALAGRELTRELSIFEVIFIRNAFCLLLLVPFMAFARENRWRTDRVRGHLLRNTVHFTAQAAWFFGLMRLPLGEVIALEFTAPVWTALLAALLLREHLTVRRIGGILLGFAGVLVILRPGAAIVDPAAFAVLYSAAGFALTFVITRAMTTSEHPITILFWMNLIQLPIGFALALPDWTVPSPSLWPWMLVAGITGFSTHYCFARAFAHADAGVVAPIDFIRLPLAILAGYLLYQEAMDPFVLVGAVVIFFGNHLNLTGGRARAPRRGRR